MNDLQYLVFIDLRLEVCCFAFNDQAGRPIPTGNECVLLDLVVGRYHLKLPGRAYAANVSHIGVAVSIA